MIVFSRFRALLAVLLAICCGGSTAGLRAEELAPVPPNAQQAQPSAPQGAEQEEYFEKHVRPLLVQRCQNCHGAQKQEADLRLDSAASLQRPVASGEKLVRPAEPDQSLLLKVVRRQGDIHMPPDEPLAESEIETLAKWVRMGAPWPGKDGEQPSNQSDPSDFMKARQSHWSFQPVARPPVAASQPIDWIATPVDSYVLPKLNELGLAPAPAADRRTLMRRVHFDLLGLPPTRDAVESFELDERPDAYDRLLDRLLASPGYGESWGRHWLDLARYGDTKGYAFAQERRYPYAYTYRDYVISAHNSDLPVDQFIREQLAADQLPPRGKNESFAAIGFLTTGRKFNNRNDDIDDQIDVVGRGLLGLTVACARCHDHKFDPIPTEDYYSLFGVFASSKEPGDLPLIGEPQASAEYDRFQEQLKKLQDDRQAQRRQQHSQLTDKSRRNSTDYLVRAILGQREDLLTKISFLVLNRDEFRPRILERWKAFLQQRTADDPVWGTWSELASLSESDFSAQGSAILQKRLALPAGTSSGMINPLVKDALSKEPPAHPEDLARIYGQVLTQVYQQWLDAGGNAEADGKLPEEVRQVVQSLIAKDTPTDLPVEQIEQFINRAERNRLKELDKKIESFQATSPAAPPRAMVLVDEPTPSDPRVLIRGNPGRPGKTVPRQFLQVVAGPERQPFTRGSGRLDLADSIVAENNPLTRRVLANRIWMHHFGEPLVSTPSDFGLRCEPPPQRALVDYLAWRLSSTGWSMKRLHREIMMSAVYQQSSAISEAGLRLDPENRYLGRMNRRRLEFEAFRDALLSVAGRLDSSMGGRPVEITQSDSRRRSVYAFIDRQDLPNLFRVFDFASPDQSNERRPRTTVPQQALYTMNSEFAAEQARGLLSRPEIADLQDPRERLHALFRVALCRAATDDETATLMSFLQSAPSPSDPATKLDPWQQIGHLLLMTNEFAFVD